MVAPLPMHRRTFLNGLATAATFAAARPILAASSRPGSAAKIKLGMDNFAVRAMGWKAPELIDYAASGDGYIRHLTAQGA